jgi:hypothetical protein
MKYQKFFGLAMGALVLFSCSSEDEKNYTEVYTQEVLSIAPKERIQELERMNFTMYEGKTPPQVSGTFLASPYIMKESSETNWYRHAGERVQDHYYRIKDQNMADLSFKLDVKALDPETGNVFYSSPDEKRYLSGSGDRFSAFSIVENFYLYNSNQDTAKFKSLEVMSAIVTEEGLRDYQYAFIMLDNYGDPLNKLMRNGGTRIFYDEDRLARFSDFPSAVKTNEGGRFKPLERVVD